MSRIQVPFIAMVVVVAVSNFLVQFPINEWLTWGALPYPLSFFITELTLLFHGVKRTRRIIYAGFIVAVVLSAWLATPKIACASGAAFLTAQLFDVYVFRRVRQAFPIWWMAPLCASVCSSALDSTVFWGIAFWGEDVPIFTWAIGDTAVKLFLDLALLTPFRAFIRRQPVRATN
jgi:uncharacterized PurR-regulated membrane protein YhhQ (DUF165 family)